MFFAFRGIGEFSWGCKFVDGVSIKSDMQHNLFYDLEDTIPIKKVCDVLR